MSNKCSKTNPRQTAESMLVLQPSHYKIIQLSQEVLMLFSIYDSSVFFDSRMTEGGNLRHNVETIFLRTSQGGHHLFCKWMVFLACLRLNWAA